MRKQIAAANWKMNLTLQQAEQLTDDLLAMNISLNENQLAILGVPFPYLVNVQKKLNGVQNIKTAAQNCSAHKNGAYTGETSVEMLQSIGIKYVIIGHSERREYNNENNSLLADKIDIALGFGLAAIFCCGESLSIREASTQNSYVEIQLKESLFHLGAGQLKDFIIAYEPIWAI
ncbi:MAG: triose-phosphate isomerase, partial [Ferruginibacter sp.]